MVILAVSLTLIIQSITSALRSTVYSADYTVAINLMENKMFELIQRGFIESDRNEEDDFPEPFSRFHYSLETKPLSGEEKALDEVMLKVSWSSGIKKNNILLRTYLFNAQ